MEELLSKLCMKSEAEDAENSVATSSERQRRRAGDLLVDQVVLVVDERVTTAESEMPMKIEQFNSHGQTNHAASWRAKLGNTRIDCAHH